MLKQSETDAIKTSSKKVIQTTTEATGDLIGIKIANKFTKRSEHSQKKNLETIPIEHDKEIPKRRYISLEERQKIIDNLR